MQNAIEGLTRSLAAELAPKIRVNAVAPSLTDTSLASKYRKKVISQTMLKKVGDADDIAKAVEFLL